ncbi:DUF3413 domain-containing protein [Shewanella sp. JM162201]|uniref:DUF3413 domain-containing protein n=1 Tax=Shewanella jiangmenensis TaxID=2837387 RepID=A0ABS5V6U6_9GAMM|nr:DUF3413 domain-containing protein [Shewanella jiangmenensis]MBT1445703.1 DUF3413 domain-containing protein [Shewanella jiangmenensis]
MVERKQQLVRDKVSRLVNWGHWFALFNGFLALIVGSRYLDTVGLPESALGWGYLLLASIGQFAFLAFLVYLLTLFPLTLLLPYAKILRGLGAAVATLGLCVLLYDTIIYDDYGVHLSPFAFDVAWADLHALLRGTSYIVTPVAILALELTAANFLWKRMAKLERLGIGSKVATLVGSFFIASHLIHIWGDASAVKDITRYDDAYPLFYPATARSFMESHGLDSGRDVPAEMPEQVINYPLAPLSCSRDTNTAAVNSQPNTQRQPNVLIVAIDGLRADMVNAQTMPFLASFSQNSQRFEKHLSGGNQFYSGMFSLMYGLQGSYIGSNDFKNISPVLGQSFKAAGYQLKRFGPKSNEASPRPLATFKDFDSSLMDDSVSRALADIQSREAFERWRAGQTGPWFTVLNLGAPDTYDTPVGFVGIETILAPAGMAPAERVLFNQYRQSLNFIDGELQKLLGNHGSEAMADTLIIVTGVSGKAFTSSSSEASRDLSPQTVRVPLFIHWPNGDKGSVNYSTSHHGIAPTLMTKVLGCTNPITDYSAGRQLLLPSEQPWVYVGDNRFFAIYQEDEITLIDRHGKYDVYDASFEHRLDKKLSAPDLIQVMREGRRLYRH